MLVAVDDYAAFHGFLHSYCRYPRNKHYHNSDAKPVPDSHLGKINQQMGSQMLKPLKREQHPKGRDGGASKTFL
jgi:hypothetical protein